MSEQATYFDLQITGFRAHKGACDTTLRSASRTRDTPADGARDRAKPGMGRLTVAKIARACDAAREVARTPASPRAPSTLRHVASFAAVITIAYGCGTFLAHLGL